MVNQSPEETALSRAMIRWSLSAASLVSDSGNARVYKVEQNGRNPAALKILKVGAAEEERRGADLLQWYGGEGAVTVFDVHGDAIFMEWLDGETLGNAVRSGHDEQSAIAFATVVGELHRQRPDVPDGLQPLRQRFSALFDGKAAQWPGMARDLFARSTGIALKLFDKPAPVRPLHGDLHHDNIISASRGWLAIDPKGLLGDPAYEVANAFRNPSDMTKLVADPKRIAAMADLFAARLGFDRKKLLGYAAAHAALAACWHLEEEQSIVHDLAVLPHLLAVYDQA